MNAGEHRAKAEELLRQADYFGYGSMSSAYATCALAHAVLATIPEPTTYRGTINAGATAKGEKP